MAKQHSRKYDWASSKTQKKNVDIPRSIPEIFSISFTAATTTSKLENKEINKNFLFQGVMKTQW